MLVEDGTGQIPLLNLSGVAHGQGQVHPFSLAQSVQADGHGEGGGLGIRDFSVRQALGEKIDFLPVKRLTVPNLCQNGGCVHYASR